MRRLVRYTLAACVAAVTAVGLASAASPSRNLSTYVLFALDTLNMKEFSFTNNGNVGVNDAGGTMSWGRQSFFQNNSEVVSDVLQRAGTHSSIWDLFANDVIPNLPGASVVVRDQGPVSWSPRPLITSLPPLPSCTPGTGSVVVPKNGSMMLGPGAYGHLVVTNGATLTLTGGSYCFQDVKTGRKATLAIQAPVQMVVAGKFRTNVGTQFSLGSGVGATDVEVDIGGSLVKFGHHSKMFGRFFAPNAKLKFGRGAFYTGQFIARDIRSDFGDTFTLEACGNGVIDGGEQCDAGESNGQPGVCCTSDCNFAPQGTSCADSNLCNGAETCSDHGQCVPGMQLDCNDHNSCTTDSCVPATGCKHVAVQDNTPCPDANVCNGAEVCIGGVCKDQPDLNCNDNDPCTSDLCDPVLGCKNPPIPSPIPGCGCPNGDSDCDNHNICDGIETCDVTHQFCHPGTPLSCTTSNQCLNPVCDSQMGCGTTPKPGGTQCDDGDACTTQDQCTGSVCGGFALGCDDGDPCTHDTCDPATGCSNPGIPGCDCRFSPPGTPCGDGNVCNGAEACDASGQCVRTAGPLDCNDHNPCTDDSCDATGGCQNVPVQNNTPCHDGNVCNGAEVCIGGVCKDQPDLDCNDHDPCTSDSCDAVLGCVNQPITQPAPGCDCPNGDSDCDNHNVCDGVETCDASHQFCHPGTPLSCTTGNPCLSPICNSQSGCGTEPKPDGSSCNDSNACTTGDQCTNGMCDGTSTCDDHDACTQDACDPVSGCSHTPIPDCSGGGPFCSLTQGAYGASNGAANGPNGSVTLHPSVLPVAIGGPGTGYSVTITTQDGLMAFLPANGSPDHLDPGDITITGPGDVPAASGDGAGTLAGQTVAMALNVALSDMGFNPAGLGDFHLPTTTFCTCNDKGRHGPFTIPACILLNASTVDNLLALANQALRNIPLVSIDADSCLTYSNINDALDAINKAFDECAQICNCQ